MLQPHTIFFKSPPTRDTADYVSSGCLWEAKNIREFKTVISKKVVIVAYKIDDLKTFGTLEKCLLMRGGCEGGSTLLALP